MALLVICLLAAFPAPAAEPDTDPLLFAEPANRPEAVDRAVAILDARYQTELPEARELPPASPPVTGLPDFFVKTSLALGLVLLVVLGLRLYLGTTGGGPGDGQDPEDAGGVDFDALRVSDPESLAAQGRYADAIHALLLGALVLMARQLDVAWPRSLTSREILRHPHLPAAARAGLGQLVQRVEVHHFGGLEPGAADFARCREIYTGLSGGLDGEPE